MPIRPSDSNELVFRCCFCGENIEMSNVDPCTLEVKGSFFGDAEQRPAQKLFCHLACMEEAMHESAPLHVEDLFQ